MIVIAVFKALPGKAEALRAAQEKLVVDTLKEEGCLRYELNQSLDDPHILIFTEIWSTEKAWKDHMEGTAIKRFQASGVSALFTEVTLHRMTKVSGS